MEFDNSFDVPLPPDETWVLLRDIERIAPCMPGAKLTEAIDINTFKGEVAVRLGPVSLTFKGQARFEDVDDAELKARVKADGKDAKGRGGANAVVDFHVDPSDGHSKVLIHTNLMLSGPVAQYGRGVGMVQDLAAQLIGQFAESLKAELAMAPAVAVETEPEREAASTSTSAAVKPVSGLSLMFKVLWNAVLRLLTGRSAAS